MNEAPNTDALAEQVSAVVMENADGEAVTFWRRLTDVPDRKVSEPEALSRLWGYTYGVTAGIALKEFPDLSREELADLAFKVAVESFKGTKLIDLELIRLLESGRLDQDRLAPETIEAIEEALTELEEEAS